MSETKHARAAREWLLGRRIVYAEFDSDVASLAELMRSQAVNVPLEIAEADDEIARLHDEVARLTARVAMLYSVLAEVRDSDLVEWGGGPCGWPGGPKEHREDCDDPEVCAKLHRVWQALADTADAEVWLAERLAQERKAERGRQQAAILKWAKQQGVTLADVVAELESSLAAGGAIRALTDGQEGAK